VRENLSGLENLYAMHTKHAAEPRGNEILSRAGNLSLEMPLGNPLGIIAKRFLLANVENNLWLIDLDKGLPAINAHQLRVDLVNTENNQTSLPVQKLLIPESFVLNASQIASLQLWQEYLKQYGIQFTLAGPECIMLRQMPKLTFRVEYKNMLHNVLNYLQALTETSFQPNEFNSTNQELIQQLTLPVDDSNELSRDQQLLILKLLQEQTNNRRMSNCYRCLDNRDLEKLLLAH